MAGVTVAEPEKQPKSSRGRADHLKEWRFRPGESGNPGGRVAGSVNLSARLKARLAERPEEADEQVHDLLRAVLEGDPQARKLLWDRHDGLQKQEVGLDVDARVEVRQICIMGAPQSPPALPESVQLIEQQRAEAEDKAQVNRKAEEGK